TEIKDSLNSRPRKTLAYMTPSEKFAALAAATPLIPPFRSHVSTL
ncbi:MAG: IS30 family transposase, partial [Paracrocinitomix sp.]